MNPRGEEVTRDPAPPSPGAAARASRTNVQRSTPRARAAAWAMAGPGGPGPICSRTVCASPDSSSASRRRVSLSRRRLRASAVSRLVMTAVTAKTASEIQPRLSLIVKVWVGGTKNQLIATTEARLVESPARTPQTALTTSTRSW